MDEQPTLPVEIRAALPGAVQAYLACQGERIARLGDQVAALQATVTKLEAQLVEAQTRATQHSGNSSRPPSNDPPSAP
jgi:uncharacterized coiled-coil protein SlyX